MPSGIQALSSSAPRPNDRAFFILFTAFLTVPLTSSSHSRHENRRTMKGPPLQKFLSSRKILVPVDWEMAAPQELTLALTTSQTEMSHDHLSMKEDQEKDGRRRLVSQPIETVNQQTDILLMYLEMKRGPHNLRKPLPPSEELEDGDGKSWRDRKQLFRR